MNKIKYGWFQFSEKEEYMILLIHLSDLQNLITSIFD